MVAPLPKKDVVLTWRLRDNNPLAPALSWKGRKRQRKPRVW